MHIHQVISILNSYTYHLIIILSTPSCFYSLYCTYNAYIGLCDDLVGGPLEIIMDKNWIHMHRTSLEYRKGVELFLEFAFSNAGGSEVIVCPCNKCKVAHNRCFTKQEVAHHLMFNGFWPYYKEWVHHGEEISDPCSFIFDKSHNTTNTRSRSCFGDIDTMGILNDIFGMQ